ncbi:hypothetical protein [Streptomyces sp. NPDC088180]
MPDSDGTPPPGGGPPCSLRTLAALLTREFDAPPAAGNRILPLSPDL